MSTDAWLAGFDHHEFEYDGGAVSWYQLTSAARVAGTPIVLVHGMQGSALEHVELGRLLAGAGPVHLLDLRGHGRSSAAPDNSAAGSIPDQVGLVTAFLHEVLGRPVVLVGNSFGAMICAAVAQSAPDAVQRLVLIGPAIRPGRSPVQPRRLVQRLVAKPQWVHDRFDADVRSGKRSEDLFVLLGNATPYLELVPADYVLAAKAGPDPAWSVTDPAGRASLWRGRNDAMVLLSSPRMWRNQLRSLTQPCLWLHGTDDPLMPRATADQIQAQLPGWRVATIARTGHVPHLERSEWTAHQIVDWLDSVRRDVAG